MTDKEARQQNVAARSSATSGKRKSGETPMSRIGKKIIALPDKVTVASPAARSR
jgi:hypothetical protein